MQQFHKDKYEVIYAADNLFTPIMGISIISLFENNKDAEEINLTILDSGITRSDKKRIEDICRRYNRRNPRWIPAVNIEDRLSISVKTDRGSLSQYSRLFLKDIYSRDTKRVLYLDCDTLVVSSLKRLWNLDLEGNIIAALKDAFSKLYRNNINLKKDALMFNSGVMLIDLEKWRNFNVEEQLLKFITSKKGRVQQGDQGILNAILSDKTKILRPNFNALSLMFEMEYEDLIKYRKPVDYYTKDEIMDAVNNPNIIHFTSGFNIIRPWFEKSNHPRASEWIKYKNISPWKNKSLLSERKPAYLRLAYKLFYKFPKWLSLEVFGFLQAYVRPILNRFKY